MTTKSRLTDLALNPGDRLLAVKGSRHNRAPWHRTFQQVAKLLRQDQEEWEPSKPKRRKGRRLRAM